jgi:hypothetical protein
MWNPGDTVVRRYWSGERVTTLFVHRVIADDERGLRLWLPAGTPYWRIQTRDGRTQHQAPFEVLAPEARLVRTLWTGVDALIWMSESTDYALWTFWDPTTRSLTKRYGNIEAAMRCTEINGVHVVDTVDYALDVDFLDETTWRWKDEDEVEERSEHDGYWPAACVEDIRQFGRQLIERFETGAFPFVDEWTMHPQLPAVEVPENLGAGWESDCQVAKPQDRFRTFSTLR